MEKRDSILSTSQWTTIFSKLLDRVPIIRSSPSSILNRYILFFVVGTLVQLSRLLVFRLAEGPLGPDIANWVSIPVNILAALVAFVIHRYITWRDRTGSTEGKLARFLVSKGATTTTKFLLFSVWWRIPILSCPLYGVTHLIVDWMGLVIPAIAPPLHTLFSCGWMSLSLMDLTIALTLGFFLHDKFSFWKRK